MRNNNSPAKPNNTVHAAAERVARTVASLEQLCASPEWREYAARNTEAQGIVVGLLGTLDDFTATLRGPEGGAAVQVVDSAAAQVNRATRSLGAEVGGGPADSAD